MEHKKHHNQTNTAGLIPPPPREAQPIEEFNFNLRDWDLKAGGRTISNQNTTNNNSRRFSASNIAGGSKDDTCCRSFRSNIPISSTASSPGYPLKDEINPSSYSFTTALKALQAKSAYNKWDCVSPEGLALNSKWSDAEKYICNPHSGQVPMECLSARSFSNLQSRITMSAPLTYSAKTRTTAHQPKPSVTARKSLFQIPIEEDEKKVAAGMMTATTTTRNVGIQSTEELADIINDSNSNNNSSSLLSPASTPSIDERMSKRLGTDGGESPSSSSKPKSDVEVELKEIGGDQEEESSRSDREALMPMLSDGRDDGEHYVKEEEEDSDDVVEEAAEIFDRRGRRAGAGGGCLSWMRTRRPRPRREKKVGIIIIGPPPHNHMNNNNNKKAFSPAFYIMSCTSARRRN